LQVSHLIPRALYLDLRMPELPNPNPIVGTPEETGPRQEQVVAPLLCRKCERRFNVNGEKWVLENGYRLNGPSRLYQTLQAAEPLPEVPSGTAYAGAELPDLDMDKLAYFGASIFWRASLRVWPVTEERRFLDLGRYAELLRRFLLGEAEFPLDMVLWSAILCRGCRKLLPRMPEAPIPSNRKESVNYREAVTTSIRVAPWSWLTPGPFRVARDSHLGTRHVPGKMDCVTFAVHNRLLDAEGRRAFSGPQAASRTQKRPHAPERES